MSKEGLEKLKPLFVKSAVRYPEKMGGGYMGSLEVFYQLHCVVKSSKQPHAREP